MITVRQILTQKGHNVWTIPVKAKVFEALEMMAEKEVGALVVVENNKVVGIISERDYARKIALLGRHSQETSVKEIMSTQVYIVNPETTAEECFALMTDRRIRHLPVFEKGELFGIVSIGDVVKAIINHHKFTITNLENYILGRYR